MQHAVLVEMPRQAGSGGPLAVGEVFRAPPPGDGAFQLRGGRGLGQLDQVGLGVPVSDPGQRPDLGVGQPAGAELAPDQRQDAQRAGDPDLLTRGVGAELALPPTTNARTTSPRSRPNPPAHRTRPPTATAAPRRH
jgi:hypothetical protein